jgi:hypothetical protein
MNNTMKFCGAGLIALALGLGWVGCETQSATSKVTIDPSSATVSAGQSITFTASGGYNYTWSLSDHTLGTLSTTTGDSTTYTSLYDPGPSNSAVQVLTVASSIAGSSSTNGAPAEWTAEVYINHI